MYYSAKYQSPIGQITLACENSGKILVGLWMKGQKYFGDTIPEKMTENSRMPIFDKTKNWLDRYFAGKKPGISELRFLPIGGEFRQEVWKILCGIPYGKTMSYGDIAKKIAIKMNKEKMSSRAVGGAVGHNPISIIIPCHRVVGANGSLTGYAGGLEKKIKLLKLEGAYMSRLSAPS